MFGSPPFTMMLIVRYHNVTCVTNKQTQLFHVPHSPFRQVEKSDDKGNKKSNNNNSLLSCCPCPLFSYLLRAN